MPTSKEEENEKKYLSGLNQVITRNVEKFI